MEGDKASGLSGGRTARRLLPAGQQKGGSAEGANRRGGYSSSGPSAAKEERERGFITCWSGANADLAAKREQQALPRRRRGFQPVRRGEAGILRRSVEAGPRRSSGEAWEGVRASRWAAAPLGELPEVPDEGSELGADAEERLCDLAGRVRRLPSPRRAMVVDLIMALENSDESSVQRSEAALNSALTDLLTADTPPREAGGQSVERGRDSTPPRAPSWLAEVSSPQRAADDAVFCTSPGVRRPNSGRRARTPQPSTDAPFADAPPPPPAPAKPQAELEDGLDSLQQFRLQQSGRLSGQPTAPVQPTVKPTRSGYSTASS
eukprot:Hpha_TRINITY_DN7317_c0_g1::TRINITY_DN7317_c0_g1_i1::g.9995::m.9995